MPVDASHTLIVPSLLALAILPPQGEKDTDITQWLLKNTKLVLNYKRRHSIKGNGSYLCPLRVDRHDPEVMSHILMVLSSEQLARMLGFWGSKTTQFTELLLTDNKSELKPSSLLKNTKSPKPRPNALLSFTEVCIHNQVQNVSMANRCITDVAAF